MLQTPATKEPRKQAVSRVLLFLHKLYKRGLSNTFLTQAWVFPWKDILREDNSQLFREAFCHLFMRLAARMYVSISGKVVVAVA